MKKRVSILAPQRNNCHTGRYLLYLFVCIRVLEETAPFIRKIHEEEMWLYKNPLVTKDVVPTATVFVSVWCLVSLLLLLLLLFI